MERTRRGLSKKKDAEQTISGGTRRSFDLCRSPGWTMKDAAMRQPSTSSRRTFQPLPLSLFLIPPLNSRGRSLTESLISPHLPLGNKIHSDWGDSNRELYLNIQKNGKFPKIFPRNEKMSGMLRWRSEEGQNYRTFSLTYPRLCSAPTLSSNQRSPYSRSLDAASNAQEPGSPLGSFFSFGLVSGIFSPCSDLFYTSYWTQKIYSRIGWPLTLYMQNNSMHLNK